MSIISELSFFFVCVHAGHGRVDMDEINPSYFQICHCSQQEQDYFLSRERIKTDRPKQRRKTQLARAKEKEEEEEEEVVLTACYPGLACPVLPRLE